MVKRIFKYELKKHSGRDESLSRVELPMDAQVLSAGVQADGIFIWALVNPQETEGVFREFRVLGTGWDVEDDPGVFLSTVFMHRTMLGTLVFHVFEVV